MSTAQFELYHNHMSTCSAKVRLVLAEKDVAWTGHLLDLRAGENLRPEYLKLNPAGVVPTLSAASWPGSSRPSTSLTRLMKTRRGRPAQGWA